MSRIPRRLQPNILIFSSSYFYNYRLSYIYAALSILFYKYNYGRICQECYHFRNFTYPNAAVPKITKLLNDFAKV